ncbi:glutamine--fructose-6-phosphate transaminase (isomerizing) [Porphyromonas sp.]|uniref:glutamine--fructose-6-phosphate transaminase (isomerizing) n=1 Tax=Porphyromonas sp. TaxID=1924944 RepID=UPI0026DD6A2B|nr:glutamine--fructose-6-phosphate transaminase (isomerizing) [Porphyromonas sp.]MDO4695290.1 glutamine--fructose-6-phosphate transaminase (isomerizing) [Porphyromonas sp.]MDO4770672.1 glutamine--fructose-6-phosphate transaminase (isomerizing) [Porphyromonas sp.]
MCGIVGYIGFKDACPILTDGLKRLEYRGYDSAGIALLDDEGELNVYKEKGKVRSLEEKMNRVNRTGVVGIAHTRWATHGEPCERNAHPHYSYSKEIAIVHNGIIENYKELKTILLDEGFVFHSDTDTEVLSYYIEYVKKTQNLPLFEAVQTALRSVTGAYAVAVLDKTSPDYLVAARKGSPLVVGIGIDNSEFFIASDATPIVSYTRNVIYVGEEEIVGLHIGTSPRVESIHGDVIEYQTQEVDLDISMIEKEGFDHFMLKEIFDQPRCLTECLRGRVSQEQKRIILSSFEMSRERLLKASRIIILGCGTSWHAALIGKQLIERMARIPVTVEYASEFRYRDPFISPDDIVIAVSQSGETADTLAAVMLAKERGAYTYGVCNTVGSSIARLTDVGTYIHVGPEIGVASTKAFVGQLAVLTMLALCLGYERQEISKDYYQKLVEELPQLPEKIQRVLGQNERIKQLSQNFSDTRDFLYLGRGLNYPVALEGALKLKEISYIHAEGYPAAEMKHGPIALVDENMPIVFIAIRDNIYDKVVSNIQEVKARKGKILAIVNDNDEEVSNLADCVIEVPQTLPEFTPLVTVVPLQLLSYHIAVNKGLDVDQPRNLAKSVTVE